MSIIFSFLGALLGVLIGQYYINRRWYADYFLGKKIDALSELYSALTDCYFNITKELCFLSLKDYQEKIINKEHYCIKKIAFSSIYLTDRMKLIINKAMSSFSRAEFVLYQRLPDHYFNDKIRIKWTIRSDGKEILKDIDWDDLHNAFEEAFLCLREKLNPDVLKIIEQSLSEKICQYIWSLWYKDIKK